MGIGGVTPAPWLEGASLAHFRDCRPTPPPPIPLSLKNLVAVSAFSHSPLWVTFHFFRASHFWKQVSHHPPPPPSGVVTTLKKIFSCVFGHFPLLCGRTPHPPFWSTKSGGGDLSGPKPVSHSKGGDQSDSYHQTISPPSTFPTCPQTSPRPYSSVFHKCDLGNLFVICFLWWSFHPRNEERIHGEKIFSSELAPVL